MKKKIFVLNSGDAWLSLSSLNKLGVYGTLDKAVKAAKRHYKKQFKKHMGSELVDELLRDKQTYGLETNYHVEVFTLNVDDF